MSTMLLTHFNSSSEPRIEHFKKYHLIYILLLAISSMISGSAGWEDSQSEPAEDISSTFVAVGKVAGHKLLAKKTSKRKLA